MGTIKRKEVNPLKIIEDSWILVHDSLLADTCVNYSSEAVSCGIIYFIAKKTKLSIVDSIPWWLIFGIAGDEIFRIATILCESYNRQSFHIDKLMLRQVSLNKYYFLSKKTFR